MSGHRPWKEIRRTRTPEEEAHLAARVAAVRAALDLATLLQARGATQRDFAQAMGVSQAHISQVETKEDVYLSTLKRYVGALGGTLRFEVIFPDGDVYYLPYLTDEAPHGSPGRPATVEDTTMSSRTASDAAAAQR